VVIPPPIDLHRAEGVRGEVPCDHYLCAGRLVSYKRTEILVEACRTLGRRLRVVGAGPELARLQALAGPQALAGGDPRIEFVGELSTADLWREFARCRALLFAADEDFGMIPLEAQACGRPVIAYGAGGSLETVRGHGPQATGAYFTEQTADSVAEAIMRWEREGEAGFLADDARAWAEGFRTELFLERYREFVLRHVPEAAVGAMSVSAAMEAMG
jgi:glycosyltransferase involved in cell wall biosynthesis